MVSYVRAEGDQGLCKVYAIPAHWMAACPNQRATRVAKQDDTARLGWCEAGSADSGYCSVGSLWDVRASVCQHVPGALLDGSLVCAMGAPRVHTALAAWRVMHDKGQAAGTRQWRCRGAEVQTDRRTDRQTLVQASEQAGGRAVGRSWWPASPRACWPWAVGSGQCAVGHGQWAVDSVSVT